MRLVGLLIWPAAIALGVASESAAFSWDEPARWLPDLVVGLTFIAVGMFAWERWSASAAGALLGATGITWLAGFACRRPWFATRPGRATLWAVLVPAALAATAEVAYAISLLRNPAEDPEVTVFQALFLARATALACLAGGVAWTVVRHRRTRNAISRLAADLGETPEPGALKSALARLLADEELEVAYWLPGSQHYGDAGGRPIETSADSERATTPNVRTANPWRW